MENVKVRITDWLAKYGTIHTTCSKKPSLGDALGQHFRIDCKASGCVKYAREVNYNQPIAL